MKDTQEIVKLIAELAMEVNESHIDWGLLAIDEKAAYEMMALSTVHNEALAEPMTARIVVTALLVENFVLNLKLMNTKFNN